MKITYDSEADAMYVYMTRGKIRRTVPINDRLLIDVDSSGNAVGIEILDATHQAGLMQAAKNGFSKGIPVTLLSR